MIRHRMTAVSFELRLYHAEVLMPRGYVIRRTPVLVGLVSVFFTASGIHHTQALQSAASATGDQGWARIHIDDPYVRDGARRMLEAAATLLANQQCEAVTSDFVDLRGQPLATRLAELGMKASDYLRIVLFYDGAGQGACKRDGILAYTAPGSRIIYLCGRTFLRAAQREPEETRTVVMHEMLHSLGLGENPPAAREITHRVKQRCWD